MPVTTRSATPSNTATSPMGASGDGLLPVAGMLPRSRVVLVVPPAPEPAFVVVVGGTVGVTHGSTPVITRRDGPPNSVGVACGVFAGVAVGVAVGVFAGVAVGVAVGVACGVLLGVAVGIGKVTGGGDGVTVAVAVGVMHLPTAGRAPACPDTTRVNDSTTTETSAASVMRFLIAQIPSNSNVR